MDGVVELGGMTFSVILPSFRRPSTSNPPESEDRGHSRAPRRGAMSFRVVASLISCPRSPRIRRWIRLARKLSGSNRREMRCLSTR
jgi:hypothetical protein